MGERFGGFGGVEGRDVEKFYWKREARVVGGEVGYWRLEVFFFRMREIVVVEVDGKVL